MRMMKKKDIEEFYRLSYLEARPKGKIQSQFWEGVIWALEKVLNKGELLND